MTNLDETGRTSFYEALDYFHMSEQEVKDGMSRFETFVQTLDKNEKRFLFSGEGQNFAKCTAFVNMGLKPATMSVNSKEESIAEKMVAENENLYKSGKMVFNLAATKRVIEANKKDIFVDSPDTTDEKALAEYLDYISTTPAGTNIAMVKKVGMLVGYPKDSVVAYAENVKGYGQIIRAIAEQGDYTLLEATPRGVSTESQEAKLARIREYRQNNRQQILDALGDAPYDGIPQAAKEYFADARPLSCPGYNVETVATDTEKYGTHVKSVWEQSGAENLFESQRKSAEAIDPTDPQEVELLINEIGSGAYRLLKDVLDPTAAQMRGFTGDSLGSTPSKVEEFYDLLGSYFLEAKSTLPEHVAIFTELEKNIAAAMSNLVSMVERGRETPDEVESFGKFRGLNRGYFMVEHFVAALKGSTDSADLKDHYESLYAQYMAPIVNGESDASQFKILENMCQKVFVDLFYEQSRHTPENKEDSEKNATEVQLVGRAKFAQLKRQHPSMLDIDVGEIETTDGKVPLLNEGAGPCSIIYVINSSTHEAISGHFPEIDEEREKKFTKSEVMRASAALRLTPEQIADPLGGTHIELPTAATSWLENPSIVEGQAEFTELLYLAKVMIGSAGLSNIELHLFGQNPYKHGEGSNKLQSVQKAIEEHHTLTLRLCEALSIPKSVVQDHRRPGEEGAGDNTLYVPSEGKIYHCRT